MLFNSWQFFVFLCIVYAVYLVFMRRPGVQNVWLLAASYVFYGWWDWRFTVLLAGITLITYLAAFRVREDKRILVLAIIVNLAVLGCFKYFNFFADSFMAFAAMFGWQPNYTFMQVILPVGISFYIFQCISYLVDIRRGDVPPSRKFIEFALYIAFFPQLVAGPIERAAHMLPQFARARRIVAEQIEQAVFLIVWGLYKKTVIADNLAPIANRAFDNYQTVSGAELFAGVLAFTFQIYCDFSAYSDIARGLGKLFGFELMINFNAPYLAKSPSDFWRRWHISLSTWLRDYVYIPFGGNRGGKLSTIRNLMGTMLLGGLWHGAAWNFVLWGAYQGGALSAFRAVSRSRKPALSDVTTAERDARAGAGAPTPAHAPAPGFALSVARGGRSTLRGAAIAAQIAGMFLLTMIGWVIFRGETIDQIVHILTHVGLGGANAAAGTFMMIGALIAPLVIMDLVQSDNAERTERPIRHPVLQGLFYALLICVMMVYAVREPSEFIYFQF